MTVWQGAIGPGTTHGRLTPFLEGTGHGGLACRSGYSIVAVHYPYDRPRKILRP